MYRKLRLVLAAGVVLILLSSCLPGDGTVTAEKPAGFLLGLWHGFIAPISLIVQIFKPAIRLYESNNSGFWYDLGFYIAAISGLGGAAASRRGRWGRRA